MKNLKVCLTNLIKSPRGDFLLEITMKNLNIGIKCFFNKEVFSFQKGKSKIISSGTQVIIENIILNENKEKEYHVKTLNENITCIVDNKTLSLVNIVEQEKLELEEESVFIKELHSLKFNLTRREALSLFDAIKDGVFSGFGSRNNTSEESYQEGFSAAIEYLRTHNAVDEHTWNRSGLILQGKLRKMRENL